MQNFSVLTILSVCLAMTTAMDIKPKLPLMAHRNFMDFMVQSRDISQRSPQRSLSCFDYYVPILNEITAKYEASYADCLRNADTARSKIDNSTQRDRNEIELSAENACSTLKSCAGHHNSIEYFECFADVGSDNSKTMYVISANASEILSNVREMYRLIENDQNRCTNTSERVYVENTATTYEELKSCLLGLSPVPAPTTTTTTTTTSAPVDSPTTEPATTTTTSTTTTTTTTTPTTTAAPPADDVNETPNESIRVAAIKDKRKWDQTLTKLGMHIH